MSSERQWRALSRPPPPPPSPGDTRLGEMGGYLDTVSSPYIVHPNCGTLACIRCGPADAKDTAASVDCGCGALRTLAVDGVAYVPFRIQLRSAFSTVVQERVLCGPHTRLHCALLCTRTYTFIPSPSSAFQDARVAPTAPALNLAIES